MKKLIAIFIFTLTASFIVQANDTQVQNSNINLTQNDLMIIIKKVQDEPDFKIYNTSPYLLELKKRTKEFRQDKSLWSKDNKILLAKHNRYRSCVNSTSLYFKHAIEAKEYKSKGEFLKYNSVTLGLDYPFTTEAKKGRFSSIYIMALEQAWQHKKNPETYLVNFYQKCINMSKLQNYVDEL